MLLRLISLLITIFQITWLDQMTGRKSSDEYVVFVGDLATEHKDEKRKELGEVIFNEFSDVSAGGPDLDVSLKLDLARSKNGGKGRRGQSINLLLHLVYMEVVTGEVMIPRSVGGVIGESDSLAWSFFERTLPTPKYSRSKLFYEYPFALTFCIFFAYLVFFLQCISEVVQEKCSGAKELMRIMGLSKCLLWAHYYFCMTATMTIITLILVSLMFIEFKDNSVLQFSDPVMMLIVLILFGNSLISLAFFISSLFRGPKTAYGVGLLLYIMPVFILAIWGRFFSDTTKAILSVHPVMNMYFATRIFAHNEAYGITTAWSEVFEQKYEDDLVIGWVCAAFVVEFLLFCLLTWYAENVAPGEFGIARVWYFPIKALISKNDVEVTEDETSNIEINPEMFDKEPTGEVGIKVDSIVKTFKDGRGGRVYANKGVSFSAVSGDVTILLGHNGAGKSTLLTILTGMQSPGTGSATVNGFQISHEMDKVRESVGLCPQMNMLFDNLTVREHLVLFGMLKGLNKEEAEYGSTDLVEHLSLVEKENVMVKKLSGGMKRRVHLGIAVIGGSKTLILDEPTSGVDPQSRRSIWNYLVKIKKERTILLSTHDMDEANILGDRIIIMAEGLVCCYGSPFFLKKRFGTGYTLIFTSHDVNKLKVSRIMVIIGDNAELVDKGDELRIRVPLDETASFPQMFKTLEDNKDNLGISSIGLVTTSIEDVFLEVGNLVNGEEAELQETTVAMEEYTGELSRAVGFRLMWIQAKALSWKRFNYTMKKYQQYLFWFLAALFAILINIILAHVLAKILAPSYGLQSLENLDIEQPVVLISGSNTSEAKNVVEIFEKKIISGEVINTDNITETIFHNGKVDYFNYRSKYVLAAEFEEVDGKINVTAFYNYRLDYKHQVKFIMWNLIASSILAHLEEDSTNQHRMSVTIEQSDQDKAFDEGIRSMNFVFSFFWALLFTGVFLILPIKERASKVKLVQYISGVSPALYWIINFLWDLVIFIGAFLIFTLVVFADDSLGFFTVEVTFPYVLLVVGFGIAVILFSYFGSLLTKTLFSAKLIFLVLIIIAALVSIIVYMFRQSLVRIMKKSSEIKDVLDVMAVIYYALVWIPSFPFLDGMKALATIQDENNFCVRQFGLDIIQKQCRKFKENLRLVGMDKDGVSRCCVAWLVGEEDAVCTDGPVPSLKCRRYKRFFNPEMCPVNSDGEIPTFEENGITENIVVLFTVISALGLLITLIELRVFAKVRKFLLKSLGCYAEYVQDETKDDDVVKEEQRVKDDTKKKIDVLTVKNLEKKYRKLVPVKGVTFGVLPGECFGLLGVNGAGKTTIFRILTGDTLPTRGDASVLGHSLETDERAYMKEIGYCPQFDCLIKELTGRQMLSLIGSLRGLAPDLVKQEVVRWARVLGLGQYMDRRCGTYSGGNKRKLNFAMSLIGQPDVIFLDEPSTGVDPVSRRNIWTAIREAQKLGHSVILTSHSMDECEALCDRLCIMVDGQFKALGEIQYLKEKFARGFTILVKFRVVLEGDGEQVSVLETVERYLVENLSSVKIRGKHRGYADFSIEDPSISWHVLFGVMERVKQKIPELEEYSINQTTLEEVFLSFAEDERK